MYLETRWSASVLFCNGESDGASPSLRNNAHFSTGTAVFIKVELLSPFKISDFHQVFLWVKAFCWKKRNILLGDSRLMIRESRDREAVPLQLVSKSSLTPQVSSLTSPNCSELPVSQYHLGKCSIFPDTFLLLSQLWMALQHRNLGYLCLIFYSTHRRGLVCSLWPLELQEGRFRRGWKLNWSVF